MKGVMAVEMMFACPAGRHESKARQVAFTAQQRSEKCKLALKPEADKLDLTAQSVVELVPHTHT
jgi:hypothetical protein